MINLKKQFISKNVFSLSNNVLLSHLKSMQEVFHSQHTTHSKAGIVSELFEMLDIMVIASVISVYT
jgi:hypothetical protein